MDEWQEVLLENLADEITVGYVGPMTSEYVDDGIPFLRSLNVKPFRINEKDLKYISPEFHERISKSRLTPGDVVVVRTGKPGACALIPEWLNDANCSDLVIIRCGEQINNRFLVYYVNSVAKAHVAAHLVGAVQQHFNVGSARSMKLGLPSLAEQEAITAVLASLDDKIDLLHRQNKTLEALTQTLFRHWFIENPDTVRYSYEQLVDTISIKHKFDKDQVIFLNTSDIYDGLVLHHNYSDVHTLPGQAKKSIQKGDILFTEIRPANRRLAYIDFDAQDYVVSTKLMVLRSKGVLSRSILFFYLKRQETLDWLQMLAEGRSGTFPQITFDHLKSLDIEVPKDNGRLLSISQLFDSILKKTFQNYRQIGTLEKLRDTLLPKLMSGEARVKI